MSAAQVLQTACLLGLFVLLAGCYGVLYGLGHLRGRREWVTAGFVAYGVQCVIALAVLFFTPLVAWWKAFIGLSCALYLAIPPVTWRYLARLHRMEEHKP